MKQKIFHLLYNCIRACIPNTITHKPFRDFKKQLYYERSQHLTFLLKREVVYEDVIWQNIRQYVKEGDLVFDIGANIGQYALRFSEIVGSSGKIVSFEPDKKNFSFLQFNVNINFCTNITCRNIGLGAQSEEVTFFRDTQNGGRMSSFERKFVKDKFKGVTDVVHVETFENMIKQYGEPDFVKIDVEGFETSILKGLKHPPKKTIFLIEVRKDTKNEIFDYFKAIDFTCYLVDYKNRIPKITTIDSVPDFSNLLFRYE